jgi:SAM-dependent methyltransferase
MTPARRPPDWQLPPGVDRSAWEYANNRTLADEYDRDFLGEALFALDSELIDTWLADARRVIDLGCGTGRHSVPLAQSGKQVTALDLSPDMLRIVSEKAQAAAVDIDCVEANLVELNAESLGTFDAAICMFSTLGMVAGRAHRQRALQRIHTLLVPGGRFIMHGHNLWALLHNTGGAVRLASHTWDCLFHGATWGDLKGQIPHLPNFRLHLFSAGELKSDLRRAGFRIRDWVPITQSPAQRLSTPWFFSSLRAGGFIACCERGE